MMEELMEQVFADAQHRDWKGICQGCDSTCCGCYPLPNELFERFADRVQVPTELCVLDDEYSMPMTPDQICPFLSRHDKVCTIYEERPTICRLFGEIPELPCPMIEPEKAELSQREMIQRVATRLGIQIGGFKP